jgi:hypothetical protein
MVLLCAILLDTRRIYTMASASRTFILSIVISQALIYPALGPVAAILGEQGAFAFGKQSPEQKASDKADEKAEKADKGNKSEKTSKADKSENSEKSEKSGKAEKPEKAAKGEKKEKKEKKEKTVELTEEEIEAEKAYAEHQAKLQALLKEVKTPFGNQAETEEQKPDPNAPMTLPATTRQRTLGRSLSDRLLASRLYLPGRLVIGHPAEFTVKGRPGHWVALAMADRDSGAKPINGHAIRLGPDRKVIALGKIPESGVLALKIYAPVAGDLIGQSLYFEAAIWKDDLSHVEFAQTITSEAQTNSSSSATNAVLVAAEGDKKRGVRIVPDSAVPMYQRANMSGVTLDSGKP